MSDKHWQHESSIAERFLSLMSPGKPVALSRPTGAHPDVLWHSERGVIGLELTRLVTSQSRSQIESHRSRVHEVAESLLSQTADLDAYIYLHWLDGQPRPNLHTRDLGAEVAAIVRAHLPGPGDRIILGSDYDFTREFIHPSLDRVTIDRTVAHGGVFVETMDSDWVRTLTAADIGEIIRRKASTQPQSVPGIVSHWLLIYGDFGPMSSYAEPDAVALDAKYASPFEENWLALIGRKQLWQLKPAAPAPGA